MSMVPLVRPLLPPNFMNIVSNILIPDFWSPFFLTQGMGLPADDLCLENAVVLERFSHRFPLVVDPAGQATRFLLNKYKVGPWANLLAVFSCLKNCYFVCGTTVFRRITSLYR